MAILSLLSLAVCVLTVCYALRHAFAPMAHGYTEGWVYWQIEQLWPLAEAYANPSASPHAVFRYPPLFHIVARFLSDITGFGAVLAGRLLNGASAIVVATFAAALTSRLLRHQLKRSHRSAAMAFVAASVLAAPPMLAVLGQLSVDLTAVALTIVGLLLYVRSIAQGRPPALGVVAMAAAVFTKPTMLAVPAACAVDAWLQRDPRSLAALVGGAIGVVALIALLQYSTNGEYLHHILFYDPSPLTLWQAIQFHADNAVQFAPVLVLGAVGAFDQRRVESDRPRRLLAIHASFAFLVSLSSAKLGAGPYYLVEWNVACAVFAGVAVAGLLERWQDRRMSASLGMAVAAVSLAVAVKTTLNPALHVTARAREIHDQRVIDYESARTRLAAIDGEVWGDDAFLIVAAGKVPAFQNDLIPLMAQAGRWDERPFVERLRGGHYAAIVLLNELPYLTAGMSTAIAERYVIAESVGGYRFLMPR